MPVNYYVFPLDLALLGMPDCRDDIIDPLMAASALAAM
jgi:hypothetical protein